MDGRNESAETWKHRYKEAADTVLRGIDHISGLVVGFNTNVDVIVHYDPDAIRALMEHLRLDGSRLRRGVEEWKGRIDTPADFLVGLSGCFRDGKAAEWLIARPEVYREIRRLLPPDQELAMGGQAGIMANTLARLGVPQVIVHCYSRSHEQMGLFYDEPAIKLPIVDSTTGALRLVHPHGAVNPSEECFQHMIAEFSKGDCITVDGEEWCCPRSNRFIATYDPPNGQLSIMPAFNDHIEELAGMAGAMVFAGFHLIDTDKLGEQGLRERISAALRLVARARSAHPRPIIHLEHSSTRPEIMSALLGLSAPGHGTTGAGTGDAPGRPSPDDSTAATGATGENTYWDSFGSNEEEMKQILTALHEETAASELGRGGTIDQGVVVTAGLKICQRMGIARYHFHEPGCFIVFVARERYQTPPETIRQALCFAAFQAASRAHTGDVSRDPSLLATLLTPEVSGGLPTPQFQDLATALEQRGAVDAADDFLMDGTAHIGDYTIVAVPTIMVAQPGQTVGLGDTISSTALVGELAGMALTVRSGTS